MKAHSSLLIVLLVLSLVAVPSEQNRAASHRTIFPAGRPAAGPTIWHVDANTGSDSNPGTEQLPFETIQRAADLALPGDTVVVRDGTYIDHDNDDVVVYVRRSGSAGAEITFRSENPRGAVIDGVDNATAHGFFVDHGIQFVRIEGFDVQNVRSTGAFVDDNAAHVFIVGNSFHHIGRRCTDTPFGQDGAYVGEGAHHIVFEKNLFHDIGRFENGENGCTNGNNNYQNHDHGIYVLGADDVTIRNNVFRAHERGWAVHVFGGVLTERLEVVHNTFAFENPYRNGQIILAADMIDGVIENNIFYDPASVGVTISTASYENVLIRRNLIFDAAASVPPPAGVTVIDNFENTDPLFMDAGQFDFRLTDSSPAINAALPDPDVVEDFAGICRPKGLQSELGAYESPTAGSGDLNEDGSVNLLDVAVFVELLSSGGYQIAADINLDGTVNLLDVSPFITLLSGSSPCGSG